MCSKAIPRGQDPIQKTPTTQENCRDPNNQDTKYGLDRDGMVKSLWKGE